MATHLTSKTALITGAGSGINFSFASLLLSKGCNVVIADLALRPESEALLSEYPYTTSTSEIEQGEAKAKCVFQKTDVTNWAQLDQMFEVAMERFGDVDIVCPGAGVYEPPFSNFWNSPGTPPSRDKPEESRYAQIDINLTHPIRVTQLAISHFLKQKKQGTVVHISSVAGQVPFFPTPVYVATKHALNGFVRSLGRLEDPPENLKHIPKIKVVAVAPARILTPLWTENPDKMKLVGENAGWVTPEAVAGVMLDLVVKEEYKGGSIVEVGKTVRVVEKFNDPGPAGGGNLVVPKEWQEDDMWASVERQFRGS